MKTRDSVLCGLFAAVICLSAFISFNLPFTQIPITLQVSAVLITAGVLGGKLGGISVIIYVLLGALGLPVFAGFKGGVGVLANVTGGFLTGFIPAAFITGYLTQKLFIQRKRYVFQYASIFVSMCTGCMVIYAFGTIQYMAITGFGLIPSLAVTVAPFVWIDLIKIALSAYLVRALKVRLPDFGSVTRF